jgi:hypothetical protein
MKTLLQEYLERCRQPSDINEHLPTIYKYAKLCDSVAEFGVRDVVSTYALAAALPKRLVGVDIFTSPKIMMFLEQCKTEGINASFYCNSTLEFDLEPVDLLFIDTLHTYTQLSKELARHHNKVKKYMLFHDTISYRFHDEGNYLTGNTESEVKSNTSTGLEAALREFLQKNSNWKEIETYINNNGLTVLGRIQ